MPAAKRIKPVQAPSEPGVKAQPSLRTPNATTVAAMMEARALAAWRSRFKVKSPVQLSAADAAELLEALDEADREEGISAEELFARLRRFG
jgi:hypothetical protein